MGCETEQKERKRRKKEDLFPGGGSAGVASRRALRCAHICGEKLMSSGCNWCEYFMAAEGGKKGELTAREAAAFSA